VTVVCTYLFCIIYAVAEKTYIGSIPFPYFSDTGRDEPAYYVFAFFLTCTAIVFIPVHYYLHFACLKPAIAAVDKTKKGGCCLQCEAIAGSLFGVLSAPFLAILSIWDTAFHANVHLYSAYLFFILNVISIILLTDLFRRLKAGETSNSSYWKKTFNLKLGVAIFFFIAFLVYIPIGLSVNCEMLRLSMADCKGKYDLGDAYCEKRLFKDTKDDPTPLSVLYDYSLLRQSPSVYSDKCVDLNTMRSVSQFFSIVGLLLYIATFTIDLKQASKTGEDGGGILPMVAKPKTHV